MSLFKNKKLVFLVIIVLLLVASAGAYLLFSKKTPSSGTNSTSEYNKIDYSPATSEDREYNDEIKENLPTEGSTNDQQNQSADLRISIVDASQYDQEFEVRAYVTGTLSNDGTCTATFTKDGNRTVTKSVIAAPNVSNMSCATAKIPVSDFQSKGEWGLVVSYQSTNGVVGQSKPVTVTIK